SRHTRFSRDWSSDVCSSDLPHANVITRAVGMGEDLTPDYGQLALIAGQRLLVCSDGLTKELTDAGILHYLSEASSAKEAAESLEIGRASCRERAQMPGGAVS